MNNKPDVVIDWQLTENDYYILKDGINGAFHPRTMGLRYADPATNYLKINTTHYL